MIRVGKRRRARLTVIQRDRSPATGHRRKVSELGEPKNRGQMAKTLSQSLCFIAAALAARGAVVIEDFSGPVDAFFLDDGSAAGLPSSGNSALEKVDDGLRLNYEVARNGPFGAALLGKVWGGYRDLSNASSIRLTYRVEAASSLPGHAALGVVLLDGNRRRPPRTLRPLRPGGAWSAQATPRLINHKPKIMSSCAKPRKQLVLSRVVEL